MKYAWYYKYMIILPFTIMKPLIFLLSSDFFLSILISVYVKGDEQNIIYKIKINFF